MEPAHNHCAFVNHAPKRVTHFTFNFCSLPLRPKLSESSKSCEFYLNSVLMSTEIS